MPTFSAKDRHGIIMIAGSGILIMVLVLLPFLLRDTELYDRDTFCPTERAYAVTVILVDKTDPLTPSQRHFLRILADRLKDELQRFEKLTIYILDDRNYASPVPEFAMCNPGTGADANELYQNPRKLKMKFDEFFGAPLDTVFDRLTEGTTTQHSPILEMLRQVSFSDDFSREAPRRRLIIVSDMLQNMPGYSHYRGIPDYGAYSKSSYADGVSALLRGVEVEMIYLWRPGMNGRQGIPHVRFWERYFRDIGARVMQVRRVIPTGITQNLYAHFRRPMDMIFHG